MFDIRSQDALIEPEGDGESDSDSAEEGMRAAVVAHGDAVPVLGPAEHDLDAMPLAIEQRIVGDWLLATAR